MNHLPEEDLHHILNHTADLWEELRNKSVFVTGGTGFFGKWIIESFLFVNKRLNLDACIWILTRNKTAFLKRYPHLGFESSIRFVQGDITSFPFPENIFSYIIHAAIDYKEDNMDMYDSCVNGTRHILDFAGHCSTRKFLLISSGAVYGKQPSDLSHLHEEYQGAPDPMGDGVAYGMAKRASEFISSEFAKKSGIEVKIARCFAFAGPYLPLNQGSALGNFINNALKGQNIIIKGDGTPYRSYMYASDLMIWIWTILFKGASCRPYNVGSEEEISISDLAAEVITIVNSSLKIDILKHKENFVLPERYIPSTNRARGELSLEVWIPRRIAVEKMADWYKKNH